MKKLINKYYIGEHIYRIENGEVVTYEIISIERNSIVENEIIYGIKNLSKGYIDLYQTEIVVEKNYNRDKETLKQKYYERKIKKLEEEKEKIKNSIEEIKNKLN